MSNRNSGPSGNRTSGRLSNNRNSGLADETIETIRKFEKEQKRSKNSSRGNSSRLIDEIHQSLLESNGGPPSPDLAKT